MHVYIYLCVCVCETERKCAENEKKQDSMAIIKMEVFIDTLQNVV